MGHRWNDKRNGNHKSHTITETGAAEGCAVEAGVGEFPGVNGRLQKGHSSSARWMLRIDKSLRYTTCISVDFLNRELLILGKDVA